MLGRGLHLKPVLVEGASGNPPLSVSNIEGVNNAHIIDKVSVFRSLL